MRKRVKENERDKKKIHTGKVQRDVKIVMRYNEDSDIGKDRGTYQLGIDTKDKEKLFPLRASFPSEDYENNERQ
jgi:hypothetical protein